MNLWASPLSKKLEVVSKPPLRPNSCVGPRDSILEILHIFLRMITKKSME
jgi:hypothetical protein